MKNRLQAIEKGIGLDWATAEVSVDLRNIPAEDGRFSGHGIRIFDARGMRCQNFGARRWPRDI